MANVLDTAYEYGHFFLMNIKFHAENSREAMYLRSTIQRVERLISHSSKGFKVVHKFKVLGEPQILVVFEMTYPNIHVLENILFQLSIMGIFDVSCEPLIAYENFAQRLGVDENLTVPSSHVVETLWLYWLEFNVEYMGKSTEELLATWKNEATAALAARAYSGMEIDLFKVVAQRKVHCFLSAACPEDVDKLSFELPVMKENGANVHIISKSLQLLEDYVNM